MIPQRILLQGFLCYKDAQEIELDSNASLWMLSGENGSGKSSIFDAVTFALFGHHRGGGQNYEGLINKDSDGLLVELDFLLDAQCYRIKRTQRRRKGGGTSGTQQIFRYCPDEPDVKKKWKPIEDMGSKTSFNTWVGEKIGLTYETFTSSVLLLQGKAEKLLDSRPEGRRTVLASIVDLDRYERLHLRADEQRKKVEGQLEGLKDRLRAVRDISDDELQLAQQQIATAEELRKQAREKVDHLQKLEYQAREWRDLQGRLKQARQRLLEAGRLLEEAPAIVKDMERLRDLREVLPRLHLIAKQRLEVHKAESSLVTLKKEHQDHKNRFEEKTAALQQARSKRTALLEQTERAQQELSTIQSRLLEARVHMDRLKQYERHDAELNRVKEELARLPSDPAKEVAAAREHCDRLAEMARIVPILDRFARRRMELRDRIGRIAEAERSLQLIKERGAGYKGELERLAPLLEEAVRTAQAATDRLTEARTLVREAEKSLGEATHLEGSTRCRHCGQELTEGHIEQEKKRRRQEVSQARERELRARETQQGALAREQHVRTEHSQAEKSLQDARMEYQGATTSLKQVQQEIERLQGECRQIYSELSEPYRKRISPEPAQSWLETTYPEEADLTDLHGELAQLAISRRELTQAEQTLQQWTRLESQRSTTLTSLEALRKDLPADRNAVRKTHSSLEAEARAADQALQIGRKNLKETDSDLDRLTRVRDEVQKQLGDWETRIRSQEMAKQLALHTILEQQKMLSGDWLELTQHVGMNDLHQLEREREDLDARKTDERSRQLEQARAGLELLQGEVRSLEEKEPAFPEEARQAPEGLHTLLEAARREDAGCDEGVGKAREELALLDYHRKERAQLLEQSKQVEAELNEVGLLAELLGRNRLQLYLVRQAERQVVEHANAVLDRLSGGQLYLKLCGEAGGEGTSARALDLEAYNRTTGDQPINVSFLSGSQKFRVAVSLALGIGQYASRQHRPIESVIIDEGFGCLDAQGRQVMIQELQNLRSQMRCILLVSHQEEFADAFSHGYHFELRDGATHVRRFQK